jgi:hypothetical protein
MSDADDRASESVSQKMLEQEGDEGSACDLGHRLRPISHRAAQAGAQAAGEDHRFARHRLHPPNRNLHSGCAWDEPPIGCRPGII